MSNFIFIHINKCGGTSLKSSFSRTKNIKIPNNDDIKNLIKTDKWKNSFKFTVVRNPYDRILSLYGMLLRSKKIITLDEVIKIISNDNIGYLRGDGGLSPGKKQYIKRHGLPMTHPHYGIYDNETNTLRINRFFKLENINEEWNQIESLIGKKLNIVKLNSSNIKKDYTIFTKEQIEIINKVYDKDFEVFGYDKINL